MSAQWSMLQKKLATRRYSHLKPLTVTVEPTWTDDTIKKTRSDIPTHELVELDQSEVELSRKVMKTYRICCVRMRTKHFSGRLHIPTRMV